MNLTGSYTFDALREKVWDLLMDTQAIAGCMPGCKELRPLGDDRYHAELNVGVAAVSGKFDATVSLLDQQPPASYRLLVDGSSRMGFVKADARLTLTEDQGKTTVAVDATADVGGAIARVGQRMIEGVARMSMDRFFACLAKKTGPPA